MMNFLFLGCNQSTVSSRVSLSADERFFILKSIFFLPLFSCTTEKQDTSLNCWTLSLQQQVLFKFSWLLRFPAGYSPVVYWTIWIQISDLEMYIKEHDEEIRWSISKWIDDFWFENIKLIHLCFSCLTLNLSLCVVRINITVHLTLFNHSTESIFYVILKNVPGSRSTPWLYAFVLVSGGYLHIRFTDSPTELKEFCINIYQDD